ncbi:MAG: TnpV protein [Lachnospiraceae bacterium]|nr:TnpV protein [Lachnospiraceae bacterium]
MEVTYRMEGRVMVPNVSLPKQEETDLGQYARMRERFLKNSRRLLYYQLLTNCLLCQHLKGIEKQATEMEMNLVRRMAKEERVTEEMKKTDMFLWISRMNSIRNRAKEIVISELIMN